MRPRAPRALPVPKPAGDAAVLSRAVVRAARLLSFSQRELSRILGVSDATASRLVAGHYELSPDRAKEWELALLLVRLFRSLDALWGHEAAAHAWLTSENLALAARPIDLLPSVEGLVRVVNYLDNARGRL
ncbi:MAG: antitoxin Xre/MbcA/ParS toxin-binding domain-containing protein [Burkholderiales bacterium]